jgi:hypothetical protein
MNYIIEACFAGLGLYIFSKNHEAYKESFKVNENLKKRIVIFKPDSNLKDIPNGTPIFISGPFKTNPIFDPQLNLTFNNAVCIKRKVSMFQVPEKSPKDDQENNSKLNPQDTKGIWSEITERDRNNPNFILTSEALYTDKIYLGPFEFEKKFIRVTFTEHPYPKLNLDEKMCEGILYPKKIEYPENSQLNPPKNFWSEIVSKRLKKLEQGGLVIYTNPKKDSFGDMRISYHIDDSDKVTVIGAKYDNTIVPIHENGENFFFSKNHLCSVDEAFSAEATGDLKTYILKNIAVIGCAMIGYAIYGSLIVSSRKDKKE